MSLASNFRMREFFPRVFVIHLVLYSVLGDNADIFKSQAICVFHRRQPMFTISRRI